MIVAFEGVDGSGKSTQISLLKSYLKRKGISVAYFKFPQHGVFPFGRLIDDYLMGKFGDPTVLNPYLVSILYAADRGEIRKKIESAAKSKELVVLDRWTGSNQAHQLVKIKDKNDRPRFLTWLDRLEHSYFALPRPGKVIYLSVPFAKTQEMLKRRASSAREKMDDHEKSRDYLGRVWKAYEYIAKKQKGWQIIKCADNKGMRTPEEIFEDVRAALEI